MDNKTERKIGLLDWGLTLSFIILGIAIYIPKSIDKEESYYKKQKKGIILLIWIYT